MDEDSYLDSYWEDLYDMDHLGDFDEVNYDPYAGCDLYDYEAEEDFDFDFE